MNDWMPGAIARPIPYRAEAGTFTQKPVGWILHVVVGNGSPFDTFANAQPPQRRFSHFWVAKDGRIEQYTELSRKCWAQGVGNGQYWAAETEGMPGEPLTLPQIASLAKIHTYLGAPHLLAEAPGQAGIGTHYMGGVAWGGHTCPDPASGAGPRSHQRGAILTAATGAPAPAASAVPAVFAKAPAAGTDRRRTARLQQLLEVTADGLWGNGTDAIALVLRGAAMGARNNVVAVQRVVNVTTDNKWGPHTEAAMVAWIKRAQVVLGVTADGKWGAKTDAAFQLLRAANRNKF